MIAPTLKTSDTSAPHARRSAGQKARIKPNFSHTKRRKIPRSIARLRYPPPARQGAGRLQLCSNEAHCLPAPPLHARGRVGARAADAGWGRIDAAAATRERRAASPRESIAVVPELLIRACCSPLTRGAVATPRHRDDDATTPPRRRRRDRPGPARPRRPRATTRPTTTRKDGAPRTRPSRTVSGCQASR